MGPAGKAGVNHRTARAARATAFETAGSAVVEAAEVPRPGEVAQLPKRLRLDLPDALAGDVEPRPDLLERMVRPLADPEPEPEDLLLPGGERRQDPAGLV